MSADPSEPAPTMPGLPVPQPPQPGDTNAEGASDSAETGFTVNYDSFLTPPLEEGELGWLAHYRVLEVLGQGGMGVVFRAEDSHLRRPVALKVILPEFAANSVARERFLREARAGAALKSDHIVTIYQVGQDHDVPFMAMELLEGLTLDQRLSRGELPPLSEALRIGREITEGLAAAHECGLIHRDIKPANVWLEAPSPPPPLPPGARGEKQSPLAPGGRGAGGEGRVKLLDFGLARAAGSRSNLTATGKVVGTPEFMSPEQARGQELDVRSDLFSLGAVLYALCTGQKPFEGTTVMAVLTSLAVDTPRSICDLNPQVPPALADLIERLLQKNPANRPASAREVLDALAALEAGVVVASSKTLPATPVVAARSPRAGDRPAPARRMPRWLVPAGLVGGLALLAGIVFLADPFGLRSDDDGPPRQPAPVVPSGPPIRIGVLHSRTGTMRISERPVIDAVLLAVEEINAQGGLLGRPVEAVVADGASDEQVFARQAEKLIVEDRVCTVFGCWTSASRKAVVPVVERHKHLLFYPVQFEGVEQSPNVVYLGPVPNQQILPALRWLVGFENKRRWFLVGSDYVFPVTANEVIHLEARRSGCKVVGESYLLLGSSDVARVVKEIARAKPDLIVNTINGDTNVAFFRALRAATSETRSIPALSLSISEEELSALGPGVTVGDYVAGNYFQSLDTPQNRAFVNRFAKRYDPDRVISSVMATAYSGVQLWAKAVRAGGSAETGSIRDAVKEQTYDAPQGPIRIDKATLHTVQMARVGQIDKMGRLREVFQSPQPVEPEPFPEVRSPQQWKAFLDGLHKKWGGRWSNPGP